MYLLKLYHKIRLDQYLFPTFPMSTYTDNLLWRYATKEFDTEKKIPDDILHELLEATRLTPTSYGIQPYHFLVVTNAKLREELKAHSWGQGQVTDASHLVIMCTKKILGEEDIDAYIRDMATTRGVTVDTLKNFRDMMGNTVSRMTPEDMELWSKKQTYIALGFLLSAAAQHHVDSCPMEGFSAPEFDRILGLAEKNLTATLICPLGYRSANDTSASYKKVRFPMEELFEFKA
ncbi:MAG: Oxygen-insensitive nitroreductase [Candidatus Peribacteria bacterium]|nr:Oxygen-insensitive nitroreductase [Candidatus Peribacteria bacterium]